ncbi:hypothetical protein DD829_00425 [Chryseobacterium sp. HMWF035]|nr:hypothetical protein DBR25_20710 [Chryseobacterium sp. HMWF001]PVV62075.1 hypothetical protein DD829_00425 [Chryseobacterium sp. HMWF035]
MVEREKQSVLFLGFLLKKRQSLPELSQLKNTNDEKKLFGALCPEQFKSLPEKAEFNFKLFFL